ncbi:MAG TPA: hypothetical protein VFQ68_12000 [Streptosporangiaceae bacterium]|nr:hypothetical protein [Streptosporangiaceae bacterium]
MIANGNQAIDGSVCSPVISGPTAARSGRTRDTTAPTTAPISTARAKPTTARWAVVAMACHSKPVWSSCHRLASVAPGPGKMAFFQPLRWISCHSASTMRTARITGHTPPQARVARRRPRWSVGASSDSR